MTTHSVGGIRLDDLLVEGVTRSGDDIVLSGSGLARCSPTLWTSEQVQQIKGLAPEI